MPDPTMVQVKSNGAGTTNSVTVTLDSSPTEGNILLARFVSNLGTSVMEGPNPSTNWTKDREQSNSAGSVQLWRRVVQSGDGTGWTFKFTDGTTNRLDLLIEEITPDIETPNAGVNFFTSGASVSAASVALPSVTPDSGRYWLQTLTGHGNAVNYSGATNSFAARYQWVGTDQSGLNARGGVFDRFVTADGSTAYDTTVSWDLSRNTSGILVAYKVIEGDAPQVGRPTATITSGSWTATGAASLHAALADESQSTYAESSSSPASADVMEVQIESLDAPPVATGHQIEYEYHKDVAAGDAINLTVKWMDGATQIGSQTHSGITDSIVTGTLTLSEAEAGNITDYTDQRVRFEAVKA